MSIISDVHHVRHGAGQRSITSLFYFWCFPVNFGLCFVGRLILCMIFAPRAARGALQSQDDTLKGGHRPADPPTPRLPAVTMCSRGKGRLSCGDTWLFRGSIDRWIPD